jgi:tetratricopeptide (TPR) repeat protein
MKKSFANTEARPGAWFMWAGAAVLVAAVFAVYGSSLPGPFVFDDHPTIVENPGIGNFTEALLPAADGRPVSGRPLVSLSLAFNYAVGGLDPWGYRLVNVIVHTLAGLVLFGVVRRTLALAGEKAAGGVRPEWVALIVAALWVLHPIQTGAVIYVVQRAESLMGLCYLLTLYLFIRGVTSSRPAGWLWASAVVCATGMTAKEVMVSAPVMVLLYDRTFLAGSFAAAWRLRRTFYLGLCSTWGVVILLLLHSGDRGGTAGFGMVSSWQYLLTQCEALVIYLRLALWPSPLVFDRGTYLVEGIGDVILQALFIVGALVATGFALKYRPGLGFLGACFFVILAPTSSVIPVASQTIAEHRMYLPLAAIIAGVVCWAGDRAGRYGLLVFLPVCVMAGVATHERNKVYRSELALWEDTAAKWPQNARAPGNIGVLLLASGNVPGAIDRLEQAVRLDPRAVQLHASLCQAYVRVGKYPEAVTHGEIAIRLVPDMVDTRMELAKALEGLGRFAEGGQQYAAALGYEPKNSEIHRALAQVFVKLGDIDGARRHGAEVVRLEQRRPEALFFWGNICAAGQDFAASIEAYREALRLDPGLVAVRNNLANALLVTGQVDDAVVEYREVLRLRPADRSMRENLERALALQKGGGGGVRR